MNMKFNINNYIYVKLTDIGLSELKKQHDELSESFPGLGEFEAPKVDEDGWSKFQGNQDE